MNRNDLDRYITGNWGEDQFRDRLTEDEYHATCGGEGCPGCHNTGMDPQKSAEYEAQARREAEAQFPARTLAKAMTARERVLFLGRLARKRNRHDCEHGHFECSDKAAGACQNEVVALIEGDAI